ncbi:hypothetical protein JMJ35_005515 [Cladonia borealis]|uniref:Uncharacterized protein n=1 Tax=Cladonia borealis TaxID=184061 RepID=A0AA39QZZ1_9LECA|nr:hypothetical protein JMJ35_005515 [Cladonia borealis]
MSRPKTPVALPPLFGIEFLTWLLEHHEEPTTLLICCSREAFLADLQANLQKLRCENPATTPNDGNQGLAHPLLNQTIHLISRSRSIHLAFVPTLPHLRAYLSTYTLPPTCESSSLTSTKSGFRVPILAIWGLVYAHRSTAEHSAQGLSRTLAAAVESASLAEQRLVLAEAKILDVGDQYGDTEVFNVTFENPWKEQVPALSGTIRFGGEDRVWAGKTIEVGRILARWCKFVKLSNGECAL